MKNLITALTFLLTIVFLNAEDGKNKKFTLNELNWLSGKWIGKEWLKAIIVYQAGILLFP